MALVPGIKKEFVGISICPEEISFCWTRANKKPLIKKFEKVQLPPIHDDLTILNPTKLTDQIKTFLKKHNLTNSFVTIALEGNCCTHKITTSSIESLDKEQISQVIPKEYIAEYHHLASDSSSKHNFFYVAGIVPAVLFQYLNLSISAQCNILAVTTVPMCLSYVYEDLHNQNKKSKPYYETFEQWLEWLTNYFEKQEISNYLAIENEYQNVNKIEMIKHLGLFMLGKSLYEAD